MRISFSSDPETSLLQLSRHDHFTLRDAFNGVHIFGGIGSGKTSGSGKALAGAYLRAGMGGLVLCAKPEEVDLWQSYCKQHGREKSVIVFGENHQFNFIDYELARHGMKGIANVIECLMRVLEAADDATGQQGKSSDQFWTDAIRQILNYTVPIIYLAYGKVTISNIIDFVTTAPTRREQLNPETWTRTYSGKTMQLALDEPKVEVDADVRKSLSQYWGTQYLAIPDKTRGNIIISLSTRLDRFKHGRMQRIFCDRTDIVPEMCFHGAVIIMNMPTLTWNHDGIIGQQLFKFIWERAVESRNGLEQQHRERPVFLWADEAQYFVNVKDESFLSTCRGSKACVVFLTQSLPTYYSQLGKDRSDAGDGIVGKFNTQIFHQNGDFRTNEFASKLVGRGIQHRQTAGHSAGSTTSQGVTQGGSEGYSEGAGGGSNESTNSSHQGMLPWENTTHGNSVGKNDQWNSNQNENTNWSVNRNTSTSNTENNSVTEHMDVRIEPNFFSEQLKSGGACHNEEVTGLWFKVGGRFKSSLARAGNNVILATFKQ